MSKQAALLGDFCKAFTTLFMYFPFIFNFHVYQGDYSSLWTEVGKEVLPSEYGGEAGPILDMEGISLLTLTYMRV